MWKDIEISYRVERNSSDSEKWNGKYDVFYCIHGKSNGKWGLRDFEVTEANMDVTQEKPVSQMQPGEKTSINDLMMVCSNCHSMIHRKRPWLSKEQLSRLLVYTERIADSQRC